MDLVDGSTKDGRIIVFLERVGPSGGNSDSSQGAHDDGDASPGAAQGDPGAANQAGSSTNSADGAAEEQHAGGKPAKKTKGKKLPKPGELSDPKAVQMAAPGKLSPASIRDAIAKQVAGLKTAAADGIPFCEVCDRVKKLREQIQSGLA